MNIKEFIENSGILEEYVLGTLPENEIQGVECLAQTYPEIKEEITMLQSTMGKYASLYEKQPPAHLKDKIFAQMTFAEDIVEEEKTEEEVGAAQAQIAYVETKVVPMWSKFAIAASVLLAASTGWFFNQNNELKVQTAALSEKVETLETQTNANAEFLAQYQNPANRVVKLAGVEAKPDGAVTVLWNQNDNSVALSVNNLPKAPTGMQYQLWVIDESGPVDMGMIDNDFEGKLLSMKKVNGKPAAFAITLEKEGGVPSPTLEQLYVIANV